MHDHSHNCTHDHDEHDHTHHHGHEHSHTPANFGKAFLTGILLNTGFIIGEIVYGLKANSLALLADSGHNAGDVLGLVMAWAAVFVSKRKPTSRFTYGLHSSSILAALANAILLLVATGGIIWEAIQRLQHPTEVTGYTVMAVAAIGIVINGFTAWLFVKGSAEDLNIRGAYLHMLGDAVISLGVVITGAIILKMQWLWLDPAVSIIVALTIIFGTWGLLRDSLNLSLQAVPAHIDPAKVREFLTQLKGVKEIHDLHIWGMSTNQAVMSVHLVMPDGHPGDKAIREIAHEMQEYFRIGHSTIQIEVADESAECPLAPDHVI